MNNCKIKIILFFIIGSLFLMIILRNIRTSKALMNIYFKKEEIKKNYIYFDLGTNNGDSILSFFELQPRFPQFVERTFTYKKFGLDAEAAKWVIYAFEANPIFDSDLDETVRKLKEKTNHEIKVFKHTAAWKYDGKIGFYVENVTGFGLGSSLDKNHPDVIRTGQNEIFVNCRDIASLLKSLDKNDFIVMKIDIEGAEYELILDFIKKDSIRLVDVFAIEYHPKLKKFNSPESILNAILQLHGASFKHWI